MSEGARVPPFIRTAECIAIIFDKPQLIFFRDLQDRIEVKGIAQCMCEKNAFCFYGNCRFDLLYIDVICRNFDVHEYRHTLILDNRRNGRWKSCRHRDYFIPRLQSPVAKFFRSQGGKRKKIGRRSGIGQKNIFNAQKFRDLSGEFFRISSLCQPEIKRCIDQISTILYH